MEYDKDRRNFIQFCEDVFKIISPDNIDSTIFLDSENCRAFSECRYKICGSSACQFCYLGREFFNWENDLCDDLINFYHDYLGSNKSSTVVDECDLFELSIDLFRFMDKLVRAYTEVIDNGDI